MRCLQLSSNAPCSFCCTAVAYCGWVILVHIDITLLGEKHPGLKTIETPILAILDYARHETTVDRVDDEADYLIRFWHLAVSLTSAQ
jgi:hypothetical protein